MILHQAHSTPGRVGCLLSVAGVELDLRRPCLGDDLPGDLASYDGVIAFGGPMGANDDLDFLKREIAWLDVVLTSGKPHLGICLGAQLLAKALGAKVYGYEDGRTERGYYPVHATDAGRALCDAPFPRHVYQWHRDGFQLPRGARLLASGGEDFPNQAFSHGPAVGLQFHPDVTAHMMTRWVNGPRADLGSRGARPAETHFEDRSRFDGVMLEWLRAFLPAWLSGEAQSRLA